MKNALIFFASMLILMQLYAQEKEKTTNLLPQPVKKVTAQEKEQLIIARLGIMPNSLESKIYELGIAKNFPAIDDLVAKTTDTLDFKKMVLFQLTLAADIADRLIFDLAPEESQIDKYPIAEDPMVNRTIADQWLKLLRDARKQLSAIQLLQRNLAANLVDPLTLINDLLLDLGYRHEVAITDNILKLKKIISENFKELFERFLLVNKRRPALYKYKNLPA